MSMLCSAPLDQISITCTSFRLLRLASSVRVPISPDLWCGLAGIHRLLEKSIVPGRAMELAQDRKDSATQSSVLTAVERLASIDDQPSEFSKWYEPGRDIGSVCPNCTCRTLIQSSLYSQAHDACHRSKRLLGRLNLSGPEHELLNRTSDGKDVVAKVRQIYQEQGQRATKTKFQQRASDFVNKFCKAAEQISAVVQVMLPQSPEYTVTFGMLVILFKVGCEEQSIIGLEAVLTWTPVC